MDIRTWIRVKIECPKVDFCRFIVVIVANDTLLPAKLRPLREVLEQTAASVT